MSDRRKRVHTLLTDRAVAGLSEREREEFELLLEGDAVDPSYEQAAAAIELGLRGHADPLPAELEQALVEEAARYWGFAEPRPHAPTLGGVDGAAMPGGPSEAAPVRRVWERSPDGLGEFDFEAGVLESSLTHGRIERGLGPGESQQGVILPAAELERAEQFDSEVDAQLDALETGPSPASARAAEPVAAAASASFDELDDEEEEEDGELERRPKPAPEESKLIPMPRDYRLARWATYISAIAALVILAVALYLFVRRDDPPDPDDLQAQIEEAGDELEWVFAVKPDDAVSEGAEGSVLWSSELQAGVLILRGLAPNDPTAAQYQLWIVDQTREGPPVDGGVFDVPAGEDELRIPVDAKLLVGEPRAFVITVERPGGVVVSEQERVAMVAASG